MNLTKHFYDNFSFEKYPYYARLISQEMFEQFKQYPCEFIEDEDAISEWKRILYPTNNKYDLEISFYFLLISFYLHTKGYKINQQPRLLEKICNYKFLSDEILKQATKKTYGTKQNGSVSWESRRQYIDSLTFSKETTPIPISNEINEIFKKVSPRNASFNEMSIDEKVREIRNAFSFFMEYKDGKYRNIDYSTITDGFITTDFVTKFNKKLQCFRHGSALSIDEREKYTAKQKEAFIDIGLLILNITYREINDNE